MVVPVPVLDHRKLWPSGALSRADVLGLLDGAHRLQQAGRRAGSGTPLAGKHLAVLGQAEPILLGKAAAALGARVSHLKPAGPLQDTARLLGRLYHAVDCGPASAAELRDIDADAGVPVYNGLAAAAHPSAALAVLLALQERRALAGRPLDGLRLRIRGDALSPPATALAALAALAGVQPCHDGPADADATPDPADDVPWRLTLAGEDAAPVSAEPRHYTLQALLLMTLG